ncbi:hypothetical protein BKA70DRAFT_1442925 [Coprinopsis sp. MPI-PUGE-AT-0042]|nr:hypothetical protein BKA70DRAFT_1442925 [Coprinopsis sp. MPI-PUGE-AT-0042]
MGESSDSGAIKERERLATLRPSGAGGPLLPPTSSAMSSSVEAAMLAASGGASTAPVRRQRGLTLPSQAAPPPTISTQPFSAEDLSRRASKRARLFGSPNHQPIPSSGASRGPPPPYEQHSGAQTTRSRPSLDDRTPVSSVPSSALPDHQRKEFGPSPISPNTSTTRGLRPMRSFHRAERRPVTDGYEAPAPVATTLSRQPTSARAPPISQTRSRGEGGHSSAHAHPSSAYDEFGVPHPPVPPLPELSHAPSRRVKPHTTSGRPSMENERPLTSRPSTSTRAPPVPLSASAVDKAVVVQQRVFIGDMQKFNMVEISSSTTAGDVIELLDEQGALKGIIGTGGWMVWEVAQDFGMERPIRSFEILFDIQARSAIPGFAPIHSGYVEWESKKGKWSKRWMELREHCIWLSKREGKDEVMLCSLSSFDAYSLTLHGYLSYFENTADYLHMFSCSERDGRAWMEKILVARSYVLHQERQVLFNPKVPGGNAASTALSRSGTTARRPAASRPAQPLISIPAPFNAQPTNATVFEPGSLLHKQP